jgi:hypothetical protein
LAEQGRKALCQCPEFLVEGVLEHVLVQVPQQVDQAFLLRAVTETDRLDNVVISVTTTNGVSSSQLVSAGTLLSSI